MMNSIKISFFSLVVAVLVMVSMGFGFYPTKANGQNAYAVYANAQGLKNTLDTNQYKNFYGISWRGKPKDNLIYAHQMGFKYVFYQAGMEEDSLSNGLSFYLETPEFLFYNRLLDLTKTYTPAQQLFYETYCALKDSSGVFPNNLATGWSFTKTLFTPLLDMQQQRVIDWSIDNIMNKIKAIEAKNPKFHFAGIAWDVPQPTGDFWSGIKRPGEPGKQVTLAHWTGGDYGVKHPDVVHNYSTYSDGHIAFYKQLFARSRKKYPLAKFIMEPYNLYNGWIKLVKDRADVKELMPDLLSQESFGTEFVDDPKVFADRLITKDRVMVTTPNVVSEKDNRLLAGKAAVNGAWMTWFGRFGGTGDMPDYSSITQVPARLKLIRLLANWENLNQTPLTERSWDGTTYKSKTAFASSGVIAVLQPNTQKLFVVFLTASGQIDIPLNKKIVAMFKTDDYFRETTSANDEILYFSGKLKLKNADQIGKGYIIDLKK